MTLIYEIILDLVTMGLTALTTWLHIKNPNIAPTAATIAAAIMAAGSAAGAIAWGWLRRKQAVAMAVNKATLPETQK